MTQIPTQHVTRLIAMERRAQTIAEAGGLEAALAGGTLPNPIDTTLAEGLVLGLLKQGVRKYLAVFGHGSTDLAEVLRVYEAAGPHADLQFSPRDGHGPRGHRAQVALKPRCWPFPGRSSPATSATLFARSR